MLDGTGSSWHSEASVYGTQEKIPSEPRQITSREPLPERIGGSSPDGILYTVSPRHKRATRSHLVENVRLLDRNRSSEGIPFSTLRRVGSTPRSSDSQPGYL